MTAGTIRKLIHQCSGADFPSTHLALAHDGVGYGYIKSLGGDVFFDDLGLKNRRFDQLREGMSVEYALEDADYRRASSVTVVDQEIVDRRETDVRWLNALSSAAAIRGESSGQTMKAVDESSLESCPASDSPAHCISTGS